MVLHYNVKPFYVDFYLAHARTGRLVGQLPAVSGSWSKIRNAAGTVECTVPMNVLSYRGSFPINRSTRPGSFMLIAVNRENKHILQAGFIWTTDYSSKNNEMKIVAKSYPSLLEHRILRQHGTDGKTVSNSWIRYRNIDYGTMIKRIVQEMCKAPGWRNMPMRYQPDRKTYKGVERNYPGYELANTWERIKQITQVAGGPDVEFRPYWTNSKKNQVGFHLLTGSEKQPMLVQKGKDHVLDMRGDQPPIDELSITRDASNIAHYTYASGSGQNEKTLIENYYDSAEYAKNYASVPFLESATSYSNVIYRSTLKEHAIRKQKSNQVPIQTWKMDVHPWACYGWKPGEWVRVILDKDQFGMKKGTYRYRIMDISGKETGLCSVSLLPTRFWNHYRL